MPKVTQIVVTLQSKPGTLAHLCLTLGKADVNVSAVMAPGVSGAKARQGKVRLLVDNPDKAKEVLKNAKIRFSEEEAIAIELDNRPSALYEVAEKLAQAKINIRYAYETVTEGSAKGTVVLAVPDVAKALAVLGG
jgi:hypothetical protein